MTLDRLSGLAVAGLGLALLLFVIPDQVEAVDYGWVRPETLPSLAAAALLLLGLMQAATGRGGGGLDRRATARALLYLCYTAAAVWAMGRLGFVWVAPVMVLALMLWLGERRPLWLAVGAGAVPAAVWVVVAGLLGRGLPG
ncbi:tripartite tricarboxylate transporter TctB family protein [Thalassobaculum sp.]|uniref:tripartite tricarboxylate transporter TctB family protein n=1 Tax=Thalassobaculum sp. TaxID=2022740 RepID=UPI0032EB85D9